MNRIAIIGAGMSGAAAALELVTAGYHVTVFDKGRAVGGRMSSKRTQSGYLDLGAQYFTARGADFQRQLQLWLDAGCAAAWSCTTATLTSAGESGKLQASPDRQLRYIGVPAMHSPVKFLLQNIPVLNNCRISLLQRDRMSWSLHSDTGDAYTDFDGLVLTMPPVQTGQLLAQSGLADLFAAPGEVLEPCWAVAVRASGAVPAEAIFCEHPKLRFVSHQGRKTGRQSCYILHFNARFSRDHLQQPAGFWFGEASNILRCELGVQGAIEPVVAHRWLYASQNDQLAPPGLVTLPEQRIWIGGDWSYGGRVENAYRSGVDLGKAVIRHSREAALQS